MPRTTTLRAAILDHLHGLATMTVPTGWDIGLSTTDPATAVTEPGGNYARATVANGSGQWTRTGSVVTNINPVSFGAPSGSSWGTITHVLYYRAGSSVLDGYSALQQPVVTQVGVSVSIAAGQLSHTELSA